MLADVIRPGRLLPVDKHLFATLGSRSAGSVSPIVNSADRRARVTPLAGAVVKTVLSAARQPCMMPKTAGRFEAEKLFIARHRRAVTSGRIVNARPFGMR
jgi:hypothetical protein